MPREVKIKPIVKHKETKITRCNEKFVKKFTRNVKRPNLKKNKPIKKIMLINFKEQETIPLNARSSIMEKMLS